ncbi:ABC-2 type transport system ATP-binding protein [Terribacillus aidingensis]|uniref:ABC-2 type transport system ATP-binding protein n=1 Tax=Terribacillus aidingensis TaxID=586416 RepID=A0A285PB34_9BACI|nr:ABC transporter ATP-binding protein [Terribacillus aidingensis]SNZ17071.1 ABC-2 type transport system ATP-binding protein [Terribacillus aidingensis]
MDYALQVKDLSKVFGQQQALQQVTFHVKRGEIFGFLGPSGSGKTTTVKILTGQLLPTAGDVTILGKNASKMNGSDLGRIGILTDNSGLYERMTINDNLKFYAKLYNAPAGRVEEVLQLVGLAEEKKKPVKKLSKGMKQRVLLARAVLHKPDVLFLDEPTSALDPGNVQKMHDLLRDLNREGTTIFLTTHNMEEAAQLCDRVAFLHEGQIREMDEPKLLQRKYAKNTIHLELKDGSNETIINDAGGAERLYQYMQAEEVLAVHSDQPTLGDIFIEVTGRELA